MTYAVLISKGTPAVTSAMAVSSTWPLRWAGCGRYSHRWGLAISARKANERCPLSNPAMQVRFHPSKACIVKSSCNEDMVNTGNLPFKGTLFLQQKAGDSSEISIAELSYLNILASVLLSSSGTWVRPAASRVLCLVTVNAIVFSCHFSRLSEIV